MGTYKRLPRGKKKQTTELATFAEKFYGWFLTKWREIAVVSGVVIALFLIGLGVYNYMQWRAEKAEDALVAAARLEEVSARREALVGVIDDYGRSTAAREAMTLLGNATFAEEKYDEAERWYEKLASASRRYPLFKTYALYYLGKAYAAQENWEDAAKAYERAAATKDNLLTQTCTYEEARSLERLGKYEEARTLYKSIVDASSKGDAMITAQSEERLLWLMAHGHTAQ